MRWPWIASKNRVVKRENPPRDVNRNLVFLVAVHQLIYIIYWIRANGIMLKNCNLLEKSAFFQENRQICQENYQKNRQNPCGYLDWLIQSNSDAFSALVYMHFSLSIVGASFLIFYFFDLRGLSVFHPLFVVGLPV